MEFYSPVGAQHEIDEDPYEMPVTTQKLLRLIDAQCAAARCQRDQVGIEGQPVKFFGEKTVHPRQVAEFLEGVIKRLRVNKLARLGRGKATAGGPAVRRYP